MVRISAAIFVVALFFSQTSVRAQVAPSPTPGPILRYAGQLLDVRSGFVFFTTGDGYRLAPTARFVDYVNGAPVPQPEPRMYGRASFDEATGQIVELAISRVRIPTEATFAQVRQYAIAASKPLQNPDISPLGVLGHGRPVLVTFTVQIPPSTQITDSIYIATDIGGWNAIGIKMDRIDGQHYRITTRLNAGTKMNYRYTRGSWLSAERSAVGLEVTPHAFLVKDQDVIRRDDVVAHWADENPNSIGAGAQTAPTPFGARPFATPVPFSTPKH